MQLDEYQLVSLASSSSSLAEVPGDNNWIERAGGNLPPYVRKLARGIMKSGKSKSQAIAIAISRIKKWAAGGGDVDADTQAKAAKALAEWESLRAKNKAKGVVKASYTDDSSETYLMLSYIPSYRTDIVRHAWDALERQKRAEWDETHRSETQGSSMDTVKESYYPYRWIKELWTDFILVENESAAQPALWKVPFTVHPITQKVTFGQEVEVKPIYIEMDDDLSESEKSLLSDLY
jgi:hypothetical protein